VAFSKAAQRPDTKADLWEAVAARLGWRTVHRRPHREVPRLTGGERRTRPSTCQEERYQFHYRALREKDGL